jgi:hypothetical protein
MQVQPSQTCGSQVRLFTVFTLLYCTLLFKYQRAVPCWTLRIVGGDEKTTVGQRSKSQRHSFERSRPNCVCVLVLCRPTYYYLGIPSTGSHTASLLIS